VRVAQRVRGREGRVRGRHHEQPDHVRVVVAHALQPAARGVREVEEHAAAGAPGQPADDVHAGPVRARAHTGPLRGALQRVARERGFEFGLHFRHQRAVVVQEREPAEQPHAHRGGRARQLVQELRVEPALDEAAPVEPRLQVVRRAVQPRGEDFVGVERGEPVAHAAAARGVERVRVGVDVERAHRGRERARAVPLGEVEPQPLEHLQAGPAEADHQRRLQRAVAGPLGRRGREDRAVGFGEPRRFLVAEQPRQRRGGVERGRAGERVGVGAVGGAARDRGAAAGERPHERGHGGPAVFRPLRQRARKGRAVGPRTRVQVRRQVHVLHEQLAHAAAVERAHAAQQLLVHAREAVLVAVPRDDAVERFGGRVHRGDAAGHGRHQPLQVLHLAEVGHFHVVVQQEQVLRLDVQVLELELVVHQVEHFGAFEHVLHQLVARDAGQPAVAALAEPVPQVAVGQFHHDHQPPVDDVVAVEGEQVRVPHLLDALEGFELLLRVPHEVGVFGAQVAVDDFDGFEDATGGFAPPHFPEPAGPEAVEEPVSGDGFGERFEAYGHRAAPAGVRGIVRATCGCARVEHDSGRY